MRKIQSNIDNPIDNVLIDMCECNNEFYYKMGVTPNMLTTVSLFFGLLSAYSLVNDRYLTSALLYLVAYYFDCADGNYARAYHLETVFGDYYDHVADIVKVVLLLFVLYGKGGSGFMKVMLVLILFYFLGCMQLGCQELIYDQKSFLDVNKPLCLDKKWILYTKFFGFGTFTMVLCSLIATYPYL